MYITWSKWRRRRPRPPSSAERSKLLAALTWQTFLFSPLSATTRRAPPPQLSRSLSPSLGNIASNLSGLRGTDGRTEGRANARCAAALSLALPMPDPQSADRRTDGQRRPARRSRPITNATSGGRIHSALESPRWGRGRRLKICQLLRRLPPSCPSRHMLRWTVNSPQRSAARAHYNRIELWLPTWFPSTTDYRLHPDTRFFCPVKAAASPSKVPGQLKGGVGDGRTSGWTATGCGPTIIQPPPPPRAPELYSGEEKIVGMLAKKRSAQNTVSLVLLARASWHLAVWQGG